VDRLRYLRESTASRDVRDTGFWHGWKVMAVVVVLGAFLFPYRQSSAIADGMDPQMTVLRSEKDSWPDVWMVEQSQAFESYSNGLRIESEGAVSGMRRSYMWIDQATGAVNTGGSTPAGIVFHTTESHIAPFDKDHNNDLRNLGRNILNYVRRDRSYHYLIDRFGRVHRIVAEEDAAGHAGYSTWADKKRVFVGLNHSFLGVAFESATEPGKDSASLITRAQIRAGKELTEMLRSRYQIPAADCVTHAQVSISKITRRIGDHMDWAANFPFAEMGLPDNYSLPLAGIYRFGFGYDHNFRTATGERIWKGLALSEAEQQFRAKARSLPVESYRKTAQMEFKQMMENQ
jgi:hypothetical protein